MTCLRSLYQRGDVSARLQSWPVSIHAAATRALSAVGTRLLICATRVGASYVSRVSTAHPDAGPTPKRCLSPCPRGAASPVSPARWKRRLAVTINVFGLAGCREEHAQRGACFSSSLGHTPSSEDCPHRIVTSHSSPSSSASSPPWLWLMNIAVADRNANVVATEPAPPQPSSVRWAPQVIFGATGL
jgi:hypothetical protein